MKQKTALLFFVLVFVFVFPCSIIAGESPIELTILHLNDTHGFILPQIEKNVDKATPVGGGAYLAQMIEAERARNPEGTILLSAGDMFQGTPISNVFRGRPVLEIMNHLHFDAMAIGNHEFDWGQKVLIGLSSAAAFPFLSANITDTKGSSPSWLKPYIFLSRKGLKIAVIGLTTPDAPFTTKPENVKGLSFSTPEKMLPGLIRQLRDARADLIIVLSHIGFDEDKALAEKVSGIDIIVGGHSHTAVRKPAEVNRTIIVQAKCYAQYLGILQIKIDPESKEIVAYNKRGNLKKTLSGPDDPFDSTVAGLVRGYDEQIKKEFGRVVGETRTDLVKNARGESNLGNLVCDAMREAAGSQIAFQNSGGIRANIVQGKITLEQVFTVLPFDNDIISMDLTGKQIAAVLEQNVNQEHGILQVSGIRVRYDMSKPGGSRVVEAAIEGKPLDPGKSYRVTTNDFLAAGGDRFSIFKSGKNIVYGGTVRDVVVEYLKAHSPVKPKVEGRIFF